MGDPTLPSVPDYKNQPVAPSTTSTSATDIWGLGNLYGQPIFLGVGEQPQQNDAGGFVPGKTMVGDDQNQVFGKTQDVLKWASDMWGAQGSERKQDPKSLTSFEALQQALWQGGFYGQTSYDHVHAGQWTSQTQNALKSALQSYETAEAGGQQPVTFSEFVGQNAQSAAQGGENAPGSSASDGGSSSSASQVSVTDPNDIRAAAQQAAQDSLGYGLSASQLDSFVQSFQAKQTAAETSTAATVTSPDLTEDAVAYAQQQNPGAYQQHQSDAYQNALLDMMGLPTGSQRPNMTPVAAVTG